MSLAARPSHRGDDYQVAIAVNWLARLLTDSQLVNVDVEATFLPGQDDLVSVDDIVVTDVQGKRRFIQSKKNQPKHNNWSLSDPVLQDELRKAHAQWKRDPTCLIELVSRSPFGPLEALAETSRDYHFLGFQAKAPATLSGPLDTLSSILSCAPEESFSFVQQLRIGDHSTLETWKESTRQRLEYAVTDVDTAVDVLANLVRDRQTGLTTLAPLERHDLVSALAARKVSVITERVRPTPTEVCALFQRISSELLSWPSRLPDGQWLDRPELERLERTIGQQDQSTTVLLGLPGCGKSALLATLGTSIQQHYPVLALRADRLPETVSTLHALSAHLGLPLDIVAALRLLAHDRKIVVLIDQLDALADLIVQHAGRLDILLSLIREIHDDPNIHLIVSCRSFEYNHDPRLQGLELPSVQLELPTWEEVDAVLAAKGIQTAHWNEKIREDLRSPHVLNLFLKLIPSTRAEDLLVGYQQMLDRLWERAVLSDSTGARRALMVRLSEEMAAREVLSVARTLYEDASSTLDQLVQAGVLTSDGGRVGFFHQTFYEFVRAKIFLATEGQLTQVVLDRQHSLRVRPQLWHALAYMRAADPGRYATELRLLGNAVLRPHLRALLVEFVGQHAEPLRAEQVFVSARFDDPWFRARILAACAGSSGWFSYLARAHLPTLLVAPSEQARLGLHVLIPALAFAREVVMGMVDDYWMASDDKRPLALFVLQKLPDWQESDIERLCVLAASIRIEAWAIADLASAISTQFPDQAIRPVARWLGLECPIPPPRVEDDDDPPIEIDPSYARCREMLSGQSFYSLPAIAEAAPAQFLEEVWPWFHAAMNAFSRAENEYTRAYRTCVHLLDDLDDDDDGDRVAHRHPFLGAVLVATTGLATSNPVRFLRFVDANATSDLMVVQRLLARGLIAAAKATAPDALRFLLADSRRFELGSLRDDSSDTKVLIRAIAPHLEQADFTRLEEAIIAWQRYEKNLPDDDAQTRFRRTQWNREYRLLLLRCLPPKRCSSACAKLIAEESRALPDADRHTQSFYEGGMVGSPVDAKQMAAGSDDNIVALFQELTDDTGWSHPKARARALAERGGAVQAGRELGALAKTDPSRAMGIVVKLDPVKNTTPVCEVLRGLGESAIDAEAFYALILELDAKGFDPVRIGPDVGWALQNKSDAEHPFPDALFDTLDRWLDTLAGFAGQPSGREKNDPQQSLLWDHGAMSVLPHGSYPVLAALSLACLRAEPPLLARWQALLLRHLNRQESPSVWLAMHRMLRYLGMLAREDAEGIAIAVVERIPSVFSEREGLFLLALARWWVNPETYERWLQTASHSADATAAQGCGELITLCAMRPAEQPWASGWLTQLCAAAPPPEFVDWVRIGVAHGLVHLWNDAPTRVRAHPYLMSMLQSTDVRVLAVLGRVLDVNAFIPDALSRALLDAIETHPSLVSHVDAGHYAECLLAIVDLAPETAARGAMRLLQQMGDAIGNVGHSASIAAQPLVSLALKLQEIPEMREAGPDLFERILEINLPHAQSVLIDLDKRTANGTGVAPATRRRRLRTKKPKRG